MTIVHFGLCDWSFYNVNKNKIPITLAHGMSVIFGIIYFNEEEAFKIFEYLTNNNIYLFKRNCNNLNKIGFLHSFIKDYSQT